MRHLIMATAAATCLFAGAARADDCGDPGSTAAHLLPTSAVAVEGVHISILLGLEPDSFPLKDIRDERSPCRRIDFDVGGETWTLFGGKDSQPPRWAMSGRKTDRVVFLAYMPWPEDAAAWDRARAQDPAAEASFNRMAVALTVAEGDLRHVYVLYDDVPDDARLIMHLSGALAGEIAPFVTYDVKKNDFR